MKADCVKCGSENAWYEKSHCDLEIVCRCGFRKLIFTTLRDEMEVMHNDPSPSVKLPKVGTHLHSTLVCLWSVEPANSKEVTDTLWMHGYRYSVSDVSSYLMMLRGRSLVHVLDYKRGVPGGSTWETTTLANDLLGG